MAAIDSAAKLAVLPKTFCVAHKLITSTTASAEESAASGVFSKKLKKCF